MSDDLKYNLNDLSFCIAEVIEIQPINTYSYDDGSDPDRPNNTMNLFTIWVRMDGYVHKPKVPVKPANINIKKIPLIGELVLIFKSNSSIVQSTNTQGQYNQEQWYYLSTIDVNSSMNNNTVLGYTNNGKYDIDKASDEIKGKSFKESLISPLQVYEGDVLVEGRSGNSVRFSSTLSNPSYDGYHVKQTEMISGDAGSPITIISNGRENKQGNEFIIEHINTDDSSLWLTSDQRVDKLSLNFKNMIGAAPNFYNKSQIIGKADRIVLSAKQDDIILDALKGIEINAPKIVLGSKTNKEGMLHSTAVKKLLTKIIRVIRMGVLDTSTGISALPLNKELDSPDIDNLINQLINPNILIDQYSD